MEVAGSPVLQRLVRCVAGAFGRWIIFFKVVDKVFIRIIMVGTVLTKRWNQISLMLCSTVTCVTLRVKSHPVGFA